MTTHLAPNQFTDALDGVTTPAVQAHLASCAACRTQLAGLVQMVQAVDGADEAADPSPLFWDHFSTRVRRATEEIPVRMPWWERWAAAAARPLIAGAAVVAAALLSTLLRTPTVAPTGGEIATVAPAVSEAATSSSFADDDPMFELMLSMASDLSSEAIHEISPSVFRATGVVEQLTPAERAAFVRLVKEEFGGSE